MKQAVLERGNVRNLILLRGDAIHDTGRHHVTPAIGAARVGSVVPSRPLTRARPPGTRNYSQAREEETCRDSRLARAGD